MYKSLRRLRIVTSVLCWAILTVGILDQTFGVSPLARWLAKMQLVPAILAGAALWIVLWVIITLSFGRIYCSTACPLGTCQDAASRLRRLCRPSFRYRYMEALNALRFPIPAIVAVCLFLGFTAAVTYTDPYTLYGKAISCLARPAAAGFGAVAAASSFFLAVGAIAWRKGRLICNTVCPAGALLGLMSRAPIYRIDINTDKCIHCGKCEDVCKSACINLKDCTVDTSRCVMCMDCTTVCPNSAIVLRRGRYTLSTPMMQPLAQCNRPTQNADSKETASI